MRRLLYYSLTTVLAWLGFFALASLLPVWGGILTWPQAFRMTLNHWYPWMLLTPLLVWFTLRFPIEWAGWRWRVLAHLVAGVLLVGASTWLSQYTVVPLGEDFGPDHRAMRFEPGPPPFGDSELGSDENHRDRFPDPDQTGPQFDQPPHRGGAGHGPPLWMRAGFNIPVYLAIVSLCHALVYFRRTQQRERRALELESQLGQARLQALRMQLQPHFLFNTLNAISTLVQTNPHAAQEMIGSLGQMLRLSLDSGPQPEAPLDQELQFLNCYLEIAQMRFGDRLEVKYQIAPDTRGALVPTFILQPLVENAIRHGIEPGAARGTIEISVRLASETLCIAIRDTGAGLAGDAPEAGPQKGIGIANTRARLESLYPGQHHFVVRNSAAGGCVVELEIPFHTAALPPVGDLKSS